MKQLIFLLMSLALVVLTSSVASATQVQTDKNQMVMVSDQTVDLSVLVQNEQTVQVESQTIYLQSRITDSDQVVNRRIKRSLNKFELYPVVNYSVFDKNKLILLPNKYVNQGLFASNYKRNKNFLR